MIIRADLFVTTLAADAKVKNEEMLKAVRDLGYKPEIVDKKQVLAAPPPVEGSGKAPDYYLRLKDQAKKENKLLVFDCYAEWCAPCKRMEKETFPDPRVKKLLDEQCIFVKVDVEKTPEMARYFATQGLPDI